MAQLIATGPMGQTLRVPLPPVEDGRPLTVGRRDGAVAWEAHLSSAHATVQPLPGGRARVRRIESAANPVFFHGRPAAAFDMVAGEHFVIGKTTFTLLLRDGSGGKSTAAAAAGARPTDGELTEFTFEHSRLRKVAFRDASSRIELLARLPDLIEGSGDAEQLAARVGSLLARGCESAWMVGVIDLHTTPAAMLHKIDRDGGQSSVSETLVRRATASGESVLHLRDCSPAGGADADLQVTMVGEVDWAFCVPLAGEESQRWGFYVAGRSADLGHSPDAIRGVLADDVKFAELVGTMVTGLLRSQRLSRRQSSMRGFFAPVVMRAIAKDAAGNNPEAALQPRAVPLAVMFCDLRGFSAASEAAADRLLELLSQTSEALGIMTGHIHRTGGVIGDFHGDAAMGFWGWPISPADDRAAALHASVASAIAAASAIRDDYAAGQTAFRCGIGIASGDAVAGRIGTADQVKVTAFGPVVNLASRLEGLTKTFGVEVILDGVTARGARRLRDGGELVGGRLRHLARVRVAGMSEPVDIHQWAVAGSEALSDEQILIYEAAWGAVAGGDWDLAYQQLHQLPVTDRPKDVLMRLILQHDRRPPSDWDGTLRFGK